VTPKRGGIGNIIGGFVAGLYSVPEGIGYASLAGVNPMLGIYSGMVPVAVAAAATGSVLMMSTLTSAIALTMGGILDETGFTGGQVSQAVFTMALLAGLIMAALGLLKLGRVVNFVSNAVMTGFVMGVAILIMVARCCECVALLVIGSPSALRWPSRSVPPLAPRQGWTPLSDDTTLGGSRKCHPRTG
jgi:MFS superfamily sulfate permease-like transporter